MTSPLWPKTFTQADESTSVTKRGTQTRLTVLSVTIVLRQENGQPRWSMLMQGEACSCKVEHGHARWSMFTQGGAWSRKAKHAHARWSMVMQGEAQPCKVEHGVPLSNGKEWTCAYLKTTALGGESLPILSAPFIVTFVDAPRKCHLVLLTEVRPVLAHARQVGVTTPAPQAPS